MPSFSTSTTAAKAVIPGDPSRVMLTIVNTDSTNTIFLRPDLYSQTTVSASSAEIQLSPGASISFQRALHGSIVGSSFSAIAGAGTPTAFYMEWSPRFAPNG